MTFFLTSSLTLKEVSLFKTLDTVVIDTSIFLAISFKVTIVSPQIKIFSKIIP